jgi:hypothetical protein
MSPLVLIVFGPVIVGGIALVALFLGAVTAGGWEAVEARRPGTPAVASHAPSRIERPERPHARAA